MRGQWQRCDAACFRSGPVHCPCTRDELLDCSGGAGDRAAGDGLGDLVTGDSCHCY